MAMEYALCDISGDHQFQIGFWGGQPIHFNLLRAKSNLPHDFFVEGMVRQGKSRAAAERILATLEQRMDWTIQVRRGYCGWLMINPVFLDEHTQLFLAYAEEVAKNGIPTMGPVVRDVSAYREAQPAEGRAGQFVRAFEEFFIRWRLNGMPAPCVPEPMGMHVPVRDLRPVLGHMAQGGMTFYLPDTWPVPSREKFRDIIEDALRKRSAPGYLDEWFGIVHSDNVAKNQIPRYARLFELQHYLHALYTRHAVALKRKKSTVQIAMAAYLGVSGDTIESDLRFIAKKLGQGWLLASA